MAARVLQIWMMILPLFAIADMAQAQGRDVGLQSGQATIAIGDHEMATLGLDHHLGGAIGLQSALTWVNGPAGADIGGIFAAPYLAPAAGRRYGMFVFYRDRNRAADRWGGIGALGQREIWGMDLGAYGGIAWRDGTAGGPLAKSDTIFAGASAAFSLADGLAAIAHLDWAEFDEIRLSTEQRAAWVGLRYHGGNGGFGQMEVGRVAYSNPILRDRTELRLTIGLRFGPDGARGPMPFGDPFLPLALRGY